MEQRAHPIMSQCIKTISGHKKAITHIAMSKDGEHLLTSSADRTIHVWLRSTGEKVNTLTGHGASVRCVTPHVSDGKGCKEGKGGGNQVLYVR